MTDAERLEVYDKVNSCRSFSELSDVILSLADEDGMIQGRTRKFVAAKMAKFCINFFVYPKEVLTREFGIRQQAIMLEYYRYKEDAS